jgi:hypothetical protein
LADVGFLDGLLKAVGIEPNDNGHQEDRYGGDQNQDTTLQAKFSEHDVSPD